MNARASAAARLASSAFLVASLLLSSHLLTMDQALAAPDAPNKPASPSLDPASALAQAAEDLESGRPNAAITRLEYLADHGVTHPDLSFNRGLSYLRRALGSAPQVGDFGQAAAGFAEALELQGQDAQAARGLEETQLAAARRRSGKENTVSNPLGLGARVLLAFSPLSLFLGALLGSVATTAGVLFYRKDHDTRQTFSWIALGVGTLTLAVCGTLALLRGQLDHERRVAVVITGQAQLLDESGQRLSGQPPLLETTVVHLGAPLHGLYPLLGFGQKQWIRASQVRIVSADSR